MKILLIDDHVLVRQGLRRILSEFEGADIYETASGAEALKSFLQVIPDVVVLELSLERMPGLELLRAIVRERPLTNTLVLTIHAEPHYAARAMEAGARGFITKAASVEELIHALKRVSEGKTYIERDIATELASKNIAGRGDAFRRLSARETEILRLLGEGQSLISIATRLGIAYKTVANACTNIRIKLGVERNADLIRMAPGLRKS